MSFRRTARFERAYAKLTAAQAARVVEAIDRFAKDPAHPSLRVKRMQGTANIWEARASDSLRFTFERDGDVVVLRNVGAHDPTLRRP